MQSCHTVYFFSHLSSSILSNVFLNGAVLLVSSQHLDEKYPILAIVERGASSSKEMLELIFRPPIINHITKCFVNEDFGPSVAISFSVSFHLCINPGNPVMKYLKSLSVSGNMFTANLFLGLEKATATLPCGREVRESTFYNSLKAWMAGTKAERANEDGQKSRRRERSRMHDLWHFFRKKEKTRPVIKADGYGFCFHTVSRRRREQIASPYRYQIILYHKCYDGIHHRYLTSPNSCLRSRSVASTSRFPPGTPVATVREMISGPRGTRPKRNLPS